MAIVTVDIDLAKNVFAVHGVDESGKPVLVCPSVPRAKLLELIAALPPYLIGMEVWAHRRRHKPRTAPLPVRPKVPSGHSDTCCNA